MGFFLWNLCLQFAFLAYCYEHLIDQATEKALFEMLPQDIWAWYTEYLLSDMSLKFLALLPSSNLVVLKKKANEIKKEAPTKGRWNFCFAMHFIYSLVASANYIYC